MLQKRKKEICWSSEKLSKHFFFPHAERRVRQRERSVCRRSGRAPLCVTLSCVITSRIIGSVGGNSKRGYRGQSDSEGKVWSQAQSSSCLRPSGTTSETLETWSASPAGFISFCQDDFKKKKKKQIIKWWFSNGAAREQHTDALTGRS